MFSNSSSVLHILIFNQQSQRDGSALLESLFHALKDANMPMQHAIFCTNKLSNESPERAGIVDSAYSIELC